MSLLRYEPVNLFDQFNNEINRYFNSTRKATAARKCDWTPAVDILEEVERYLLTADIPGVSREDVDITLEDGVLTVRGERKPAGEEQTDSYRRRERVHGSFLRQFTLPETVDEQHISATVKDGVLEIGIPKQAKPEARKITVN